MRSSAAIASTATSQEKHQALIAPFPIPHTSHMGSTTALLQCYPSSCPAFYRVAPSGKQRTPAPGEPRAALPGARSKPAGAAGPGGAFPAGKQRPSPRSKPAGPSFPGGGAKQARRKRARWNRTHVRFNLALRGERPPAACKAGLPGASLPLDL